MKKNIVIEHYATDNKDKINVVKRYSNGTYYTNQIILGKQFYRKWQQISLKSINQLIRSNFAGEIVKPIKTEII